MYVLPSPLLRPIPPLGHSVTRLACSSTQLLFNPLFFPILLVQTLPWLVPILFPTTLVNIQSPLLPYSPHPINPNRSFSTHVPSSPIPFLATPITQSVPHLHSLPYSPFFSLLSLPSLSCHPVFPFLTIIFHVLTLFPLRHCSIISPSFPRCHPVCPFVIIFRIPHGQSCNQSLFFTTYSH